MVRRPNVYHERDEAYTKFVSAVFKANTNNAILLEKYLRQKGAKALTAQGRQTPAIDHSDSDEYDHILNGGDV
jgi:hypothetical protein